MHLKRVNINITSPQRDLEQLSHPDHPTKNDNPMTEMDMDDATADLILALQYEDSLEFDRDVDIKHGGIDRTDVEVALDLHRELLRNDALKISDHRYSEKVRANDTNDSQPASPIDSLTPAFDRLLAESITPHQTGEDPRSLDCTACGEGKPETLILSLPCDHRFCTQCMLQLFELAMKEEAFFPPRCCKQPIPLSIIGKILTDDQSNTFEEKTIEHDTNDKTYCHATDCGRFIVPSKIKFDKATCATCSRLTCAVCKSEAHDGECPKDPAYITFKEAAATAGFQACFHCKRVLELEFGCNHMT